MNAIYPMRHLGGQKLKKKRRKGELLNVFQEPKKSRYNRFVLMQVIDVVEIRSEIVDFSLTNFCSIGFFY